MLDTFFKNLVTNWKYSNNFLTKLKEKSFDIEKCDCCEDWFIKEKNFFIEEDLCERCSSGMYIDDVHSPKFKMRMFILWQLLKCGPYESWRNIIPEEWSFKELKYTLKTYISPFAKAILCLLVDHQCRYRKANEFPSEVGYARHDLFGGGWIISVFPDRMGYELDFESDDFGY